MKKESLKRFILSILMVFTSIFQIITPAYAITTTLNRDTRMSDYLAEIEHTDNLGAHHSGGGKRVFKIGSTYAYCIESDVGIASPYIYEDGNDAEDVLTNGRHNILTTWDQKYNMMSALLTLIPSTITNDNKTEHIHWLVGQVMIWEITGEERANGFVYNGVTYSGATAYRNTFVWDYEADKNEFDRFYSEVESKM